MPIFEVTPRAATQILNVAQTSQVIPIVLRIAAVRQADASIQYQMGFDEIKANDVHLTFEQVEVVFEPIYKELLNGAMLDFVELEPGDFRFIFLNPNDPHYIPPDQKQL